MAVGAGLFLGTPAYADVVAEPRYHPPIVPRQTESRDPVGLARRDPEIAKMIVAARSGQSDATGPVSGAETAVQIKLSGQCGIAGCSSTTLVAFSFRTSGANPTSSSVLALVTCPAVQSAACTVAPADVRPRN